MKALVLMAGKGNRMRPLTWRRPKGLVACANESLGSVLLERFRAIGVREAAFVANHGEAELSRWLRRQRRTGIRLSSIHQTRPDGTGGAVRSAKTRGSDPVLVVYGDTLPGVDDLRRIAQSKQATIAAWKVDDARPFGALQIVGSNLRRIVEKSPRPPSNLINGGLYKLNREILEICTTLKKSPRGEYELTDAINEYIRRGGKVKVIRLKEWHHLSYPWDLLTIQEHLMKNLTKKIEGTVEKGVTIHGPVQIGKGTLIKSGTYLEGPVILGKDCRIGPNAYLRPSTAIGDGCHVGASVEIKNSILMERVNVPHLSYIGDSVIGSDTNIGAGTSTANLKVTPKTVRVTGEDGTVIDSGRRKLGAIIGDHVKIGINCSLAPGTGNTVVGERRPKCSWRSRIMNLFPPL